LNPTSIAFIPDGNRRYAKSRGIALAKAYQLGTQKAWDVLDWMAKYPKIKTGTFYTLSLENFLRKKTEISILFRIFEKELDKVTKSGFIEENGICLKFLGRTHLFPKSIRKKMLEAEKFSEGFSEKKVNLALGYNGQAEIVDAAKALAQKYKDSKISLSSINEKTFHNYLYSEFPDPDLLIRTSGTQRLSGFLTYQTAYSELYFIDKYWPEITQADLDSAIHRFDERERRFGK
jgi:tritrans,polycis-undecaprenyl-diphosphate synthase [geranylgeranyl-diphosphate specific]